MLGEKQFDLTVGRTYALKNRITLEAAAFTVRSMVEYNGGAVLYGVTGKHGITPVKGVSRAVVPEREAVAVFIPGAVAVEIEQFCQFIGSPFIGMVFSDQVGLINITQTVAPPTERYYPIIAAPLPCWYGPEVRLMYFVGGARPAPGQRNTLLKLGITTIDLWNDWRKANHQLPAWALAAKRTAELKRSLVH